MRQASDKFIANIPPQGVAMFYYSGHGVRVGDENYLIPVQSPTTTAEEITGHGISANEIARRIQAANANVNIMILDSCRNNLTSDASGFPSRGFGQMEMKGMIVSYATGLGDFSYGEKTERNSHYTAELLKAMQQYADFPIEMVFKQTQSAVYALMQQNQMPWMGNGLVHNFCLSGCRGNN
jgi:uncharacterized caspase-like protein